MTHLLAILGLGALCALWVALQRASGDDSPGAGGGCRACGGGERCADDAIRSGRG